MRPTADTTVRKDTARPSSNGAGVRPSPGAATSKQPSAWHSSQALQPSHAAAPGDGRTPAEQDAWILAQRPARNHLDAQRPYAFLVEEERAESGAVVDIATIFLTNRECPWRCLMCDLWRNTLAETVPLGAIPAQVDYALVRLPPAREIKLYNSGSFFDPGAIPSEDHPAIAERVRQFERVIVECHPALVGERCLRFRDLLDAGQPLGAPASVPASVEDRDLAGRDAGTPTRAGGTKLEVAMGLETAHPETLSRLNKRMSLEQFARAAEFLRQNEIALRVFILVKPPFLDEAESLHWAKRSLDFAFDCGAAVASLIPTRPGNGALEALAARGQFSPPKLLTLEQAAKYGVSLRRGRVFADLWDLERFSDCAECFPARLARLRGMNLSQTVTPGVECDRCGLNSNQSSVFSNQSDVSDWSDQSD